MKIAMMVRGYISVPRPADMIYAPIDLAVALSQGLVKRGHKVDLYAPMGSSVKGVRVQSANLHPLVQNQEEFRELLSDVDKLSHYFPANWENYLVKQMFDRALEGRYDVLHFHHPETALLMAYSNQDIQVLYTLHDPIYDWHKEMYELYSSPNQHFASISNNQRRDAPDLNYIRTLYNGVSIKDYPFSAEPEDYLLYAGRIVPEKGVKEAIAVAKESHHRLLIIGPVYQDSQRYFDQYIKPQLNDQILYLGYMDQKQLPKYYQKAKALLTPVQWEEPFGLTTIEAMASGTPVISFRRGAAPELLVDGKTGFVVDTTAQMIEAVAKIKRIKRADCRDHVKQKFSTANMVRNYEDVFEQIIIENKRISPRIVRRRLQRVPKLIRDASSKQRLRKIMRSTTTKKPK